jgi:hypothetical protein
MRRTFSMLVLLLVVSLPFSTFAHKEPLPAELMQAKTVYIQPDRADHTFSSEARACSEELSKWGRLKIVSNPKEADVIVLIRTSSGSTHYTRTGNVMTPSTSLLYTVEVWKASPQKQLWHGTLAWDALFRRTPTKSLIKELQKSVEEQEKKTGIQQASASGDVATNSAAPSSETEKGSSPTGNATSSSFGSLQSPTASSASPAAKPATTATPSPTAAPTPAPTQNVAPTPNPAPDLVNPTSESTNAPSAEPGLVNPAAAQAPPQSSPTPNQPSDFQPTGQQSSLGDVARQYREKKAKQQVQQSQNQQTTPQN